MGDASVYWQTHAMPDAGSNALTGVMARYACPDRDGTLVGVMHLLRTPSPAEQDIATVPGTVTQHEQNNARARAFTRSEKLLAKELADSIAGTLMTQVFTRARAYM